MAVSVRALLLIVMLAIPAVVHAAPPLHVTRATGPIVIDGNLDDPGWKNALRFDTWYETDPGDNIEPNVKTIGWLTYDDRFVYVAFRCFDPNPREVHAQYNNHDSISGTNDDAVAVVLDTHNDGKTGLELFVTASGTQADAVADDATGAEDFSPDFFWDSAVKIDASGWSVEIRIPFSSLRYDDARLETWGIVLFRNRPRDRRYQLYTSPIPRGTNCFVCTFAKVTGFEGLPAGGHVIAAPYVTGKENGEPRRGLGAPVVMDPAVVNVGADVKWIPNSVTAIDATINPDFSQVESDVATISTNQRFAIFNAEKRPFFLEGVDLLTTPIQAVYTRTITSPRWGMRATGKSGENDYTLLVTDDRGGGSVILPSPTGSAFANQDFSSAVGIARIRHQFANQSFISLLATTREDGGGGHDRVVGPDFQWRVNRTNTITGQFLVSNATTPNRADLAPEWDGRKLSSYAAVLSWKWSTRSNDFSAQRKDIGDDFRADNGFVTQTGFRSNLGEYGHTFWPSGFFSRVRTFVTAESDSEQDGSPLYRLISGGVDTDGRHRLNARLRFAYDRVRNGDSFFNRGQFLYNMNFAVNGVISQVNLGGFAGQDVDFANNRLGRTVDIAVGGILRPTSRLQINLTNDVRWLTERPDDHSSRLFTAQVERVRAQYVLNSRMFVRAIAQNTRTNRNVTLYDGGAVPHNGSLATQFLFAYTVNWQSVLFVGFGDLREAGPYDGNLQESKRQLFIKISRAFLR
ncbi:MAG TPA: DUF5916 domain-containing protein [Thermoanaerobaculia bacterium]|nr:DUF5916 domain-containing protein [Thermoanaerobaculia bacterium]